MRVHVHTKFCFLCVLTFLFQCVHCHDEGQHGERRQGEGDGAQSDLQISQAPYAASGATLSPGAGAARGGDTLEEEQRFYIQQLFSRYGRKDQLDFEGFQSLLLSLGLGEVKVVGVEHEELGHDHVAHLDMLEVQDGLHSHAPGPDGHGHGQANPGNPVDHHHQHPHTEQAPTKCSDVEPTADGPPHDHDHDHEHDHHEHDHHEHDHDSDSHHKHDGHNHEDEEQAQTPASDEDVSRPHEHGDTPLRQTPPTTQTPSAERERLTTAQAEPPGEASRSEASPTAAPESRSKRPRNRAKGPRGRNKAPAPLAPLPGERDAAETHRDHGHDHDHPHGHRGQHGHAHSSKEKREAPGGFLTPTLPGPLRPGHLGGVSHQHEECLNLTQLLTYYGLNPDSLISPVQFAYLCPALLYQIDSRFCIRHTHQLNVEQEELPPVNSAWVWVWGFVSITIISLLSLLGVVLVPILNQACFKFLLTFLVALAVGTLSGDALLHLLPHSQGQHSHSPPGEVQEEKEEDWLVAFDGVWKGLTALAGIYLLFIIEHCIGMFKHYKDQGGTFCVRKGRGEEAKIGRKLSDHKLNRRSDAEWLHLKPLDKGPDSSGVSCDNGHNDTQLTELQPPDSPTLKEPLAPADPRHPAPSSPAKESSGGKVKKRGHGHSHGHGHAHGGNCHTDQEMKDAGIASIAWMVIMGDGMHNFSDGLAIGAAFSANITGGISTSVAVFCHELPHELGDFAVLLKAGMSVKQAIVYNLLSALMAYVGMLIGTAVGQYTHNVTSWIFAITAGMFLYVALVDMLPEMLHGDSEEHKRCQLGHFVLQNLGLMTGFVIMLLIAIFEDRIVIDFGFQ